jgi:PAS domain S-box-containing protein
MRAASPICHPPRPPVHRLFATEQTPISSAPYFARRHSHSSGLAVANRTIKNDAADAGVLWRRLLDAIPAAAYTCDAEGLITYFNPFAEALWGRAPHLCSALDRFCGSYRLFLPDGTPVRHEDCWMARALQEGKPYVGRRIVVERLDGSRFLGEAYAYPLRNQEDQIVGALNLVADMTARAHSIVSPRPHLTSVPKGAALAMIEIAASVLTAMPWQSAA